MARPKSIIVLWGYTFTDISLAGEVQFCRSFGADGVYNKELESDEVRSVTSSQNDARFTVT
jgi:hypothetical protein